MIATPPVIDAVGPRRRSPWLAVPDRWAASSRARARVLLAAIAMLVVVVEIAARAPTVDPLDGSTAAAVVDDMRHGGDYYTVAADGARAAGLSTSVPMVPPPTLFVVESRVPGPLTSAAALLLATAVVLAWYARFGAVLTDRRARIAGLLLMLVGLAVTLRPPLAAVPEGWAGLLIALSLARRRPGRIVEPVALGLAAAMLAPAALGYVAVMAIVAWRGRAEHGGGSREATGWAIVLLAGVAVVALHARALAIVGPDAPEPLAGGDGPSDPLAALALATGLRVLPAAIAMPLVVLATTGWAIRREAGVVVATLIVLAGVSIALAGMPNAALLVAPLLPLGLLAMPDAIRALVAAAFDGRRITVTRLGSGGTRR